MMASILWMATAVTAVRSTAMHAAFTTARTRSLSAALAARWRRISAAMRTVTRSSTYSLSVAAPYSSSSSSVRSVIYLLSPVLVHLRTSQCSRTADCEGGSVSACAGLRPRGGFSRAGAGAVHLRIDSGQWTPI